VRVRACVRALHVPFDLRPLLPNANVPCVYLGRRARGVYTVCTAALAISHYDMELKKALPPS
jgi:hypothetical protein